MHARKKEPPEYSGGFLFYIISFTEQYTALDKLPDDTIFRVSKIIKNVQTWATVGQILTAVGGGLSVIFDEASTGADKANAGFQMLVSTASAFGPYGMLAAGILTVAKAGLEAVGWWEKIEDLCKSTSEKLAEIDDATSKNNVPLVSSSKPSCFPALLNA